jgi:hypothetical protein
LVIIRIPRKITTFGAIPVHIGGGGIKGKPSTNRSVAGVVGRSAAFKGAVVSAASNFG